ncbi:MAG: hypothetical protein EXS05_20370 [Planctomycetaceae bacterium]|nr:hypothetical protein [Planctomycetaceae bacterium]
MVLTSDGWQPEKGHETLSVVRELVQKRVWFAEPLISSTEAEVRSYGVDVQAIANTLNPETGGDAQRQKQFTKLEQRFAAQPDTIANGRLAITRNSFTFGKLRANLWQRDYQGASSAFAPFYGIRESFGASPRHNRWPERGPRPSPSEPSRRGHPAAATRAVSTPHLSNRIGTLVATLEQHARL